MAGKSAKLEAREAAFRLYCECGGNVAQTVRELKKAGRSISRPTLTAWIKKYNFKERMAAADAKARDVSAATRTTEEELLAALLDRKAHYERYLKSLGKTIDTQADYAYTHLVNTIIKIKNSIGADKAALFMAFMKEFVSYVSTEDPTAMDAIERNLDGFVEHVRKKYGS